MWRRILLAVIVVGLATATVVKVLLDAPAEQIRPIVPMRSVNRPNPIPPQGPRDGYLTSESCRECHPDQHASWHKTFHRTMTQLATPESVLAPFDGTRLVSWGQTFTFKRDGDEYWVNMPDLDWQAQCLQKGINPRLNDDPPMSDRRVVMTTGSHNKQLYWVEGVRPAQPIRLPVAWLIRNKRLVPLEESFLQPPGVSDKLGDHYFYETEALWNTSCSECHSLAARPGLNLITGEIKTEVAELGISCEHCHGPGEEHVRFHTESATDSTHTHTEVDGQDSTIVNPARVSHKTATQICGRCHIDFLRRPENRTEGLRYRAGDDLEKWVDVPWFSELKGDWTGRIYWPDGTQRVSGDEFLGTAVSPCFQKGTMSCLSCHSMHNSDPEDQLASHMDGNEACLQCHTSMRGKVSTHTHHPEKSSGSRCYNCHMPRTAYAFFSAQMTHRIDSPSVQNTLASGKPNACNLCHLDQTLQWTARQLSQWYGQPKVDLSDDGKQIAASALWLLRGNAVQRAIAAWHYSWPPAQEVSAGRWQARLLAQLLDDPYSAVRFIAHRSLRQQPSFERFSYDFIAEPQLRRLAKQRAIKQSDAMLPVQGERVGRRILLNADGKPLHEKVQRLLQQRDNSPVELFE